MFKIHSILGRKIFPNGDLIESEFRLKLAHGWGNKTRHWTSFYKVISLSHLVGHKFFSNGDYYEGDFKEDKLEGRGMLFKAEGKIF